MQAVDNFYDLIKHLNHKIRVVGYGVTEDTADGVAIECEDCKEVLFNFDKPFYNEDGVCESCGGDVYIAHPVSNGNMYCDNAMCEHSNF